MAFCLGSQALQELTQVTIHPEQALELVEPRFHGLIETVVQTSDEFFREFFIQDEKNRLPYYTRIFDMIYIDGDHQTDVAERDLRNSIRCLAPGGIILCHDIEETCIGFLGLIFQRVAQENGLEFHPFKTNGNGLGVILAPGVP